ncbi:MAG: hypothetical protein AAGA18_06730 [Verrucomicrobiota bacterium]
MRQKPPANFSILSEANTLGRSIASTRCFIHEDREAVAKCIECHNFFCSECVVDYEGRMLCNHCLAEIVAKHKDEEKTGSRWGVLAKGSGLVLSIILLWVLFSGVGFLIQAIPDNFHEGGFVNKSQGN